MTATDSGVSPALRFRLLDMPLPLFVAAEALWRGLMREYLLRSFGGAVQAYGVTEVNRALQALDAVSAAVLPVASASATSRADVQVAASDVTPGDFATMQAVLDDAVQLSRTEELLLLPPLPEVIALRNWFCGQAIDQSGGEEPTPWRLPGEQSDPASAPVTWDRSIEPPSDVCWILGDDHNRIVAASGPVLELLGWAEGQLVGQRLLAVIPPDYREAHLASFTRAVHGQGSLFGVPLELSALASDGGLVPITLTLSRHSARGGRAVFLGTMVHRATE